MKQSFLLYAAVAVFLFGFEQGNLFFQEPPSAIPKSESVPLYRFTIEPKTAEAINYRHLKGSTKIDFKGTPLAPNTRGEATMERKNGAIVVHARFINLDPATKFGPELLTYVLWSISPEGRAMNLGELIPKKGRCDINVTTQLQSFGLIVTAEPYYAVTTVGNVVVLVNVVRKDTVGKVEDINTRYELLERGDYTLDVDPADLTPAHMDKKTPLDLYQARLAVKIAKDAQADTYAAEVFQKTQQLLALAEDYQSRRKGRKLVMTTAREAVQTAEDARLISLKRREAELQEQELTTDRGNQPDKDKSKSQADLKKQFNAIFETQDSVRGFVMMIPDTFFSLARTDLKPVVREKLRKLSEVAMAHPDLKWEIDGHTDNVGGDEFNKKLSEKRAEMVRNYLIEQGIPSSSVESRGFGPSKPVASNDTAEGRKKNRRVEIVVSSDGRQSTRVMSGE